MAHCELMAELRQRQMGNGAFNPKVYVMTASLCALVPIVIGHIIVAAINRHHGNAPHKIFVSH